MDEKRTRDQEIGYNLTRLRGDMSQQALADKMRAAGFDWAQATVWSVEKGKRPVRLAEAEALVDIFGVELSDLLNFASTYVLSGAITQLVSLEVELEAIASRYEQQLREAVRLADVLVSDGVPEGEVEDQLSAGFHVDEQGQPRRPDAIVRRVQPPRKPMKSGGVFAARYYGLEE